MADTPVGWIMTGLFQGIGTGVALWFTNRYTHRKLDAISEKYEEAKKELKQQGGIL